MLLIYLLAALQSALWPADAASASAMVEYRIGGEMAKDADSDNLFGSRMARVPFEIRFTADARMATKVPAGRRTSLPSFPSFVLHQHGFLLPVAALQSFAFRAPGSDASFELRDLIADETTSGVIFLTGDLQKPTGASILLVNGVSGQFQLGILACSRQCILTGGLVIDRAGPFGIIEKTIVHSRTVSPQRARSK
jgi:hypothetical protein